MLHRASFALPRQAAALAFLVAATAPIPSAAAAAPADAAPTGDIKYPAEAIVGEWWTESHDAKIRYMRADDGTYTGVLSWGDHPHKDTKNPDPKLRDRSVIGIVLMWHLRYDEGEYVDGFVYNPEDGRTYSVNAEVLNPDCLKVRGYLGISLFGQTQKWTRAR